MQRCHYWIYLNEDGEENDNQSGGDKHLPWLDVVRFEHFDQGEADGTPQTSVSHNKLFLDVNGLQPESIGHGRQKEDA